MVIYLCDTDVVFLHFLRVFNLGFENFRVNSISWSFGPKFPINEPVKKEQVEETLEKGLEMAFQDTTVSLRGAVSPPEGKWGPTAIYKHVLTPAPPDVCCIPMCSQVC